MSDVSFHPLVARWFAQRFAAPTAPQSEGWGAIAAGRDTLIAAPTGSGKTLAAFLWALNGLIDRARSGTLEDAIGVVYVSPLKALANDIRKNLQQPLQEIEALANAEGILLPPLRVLVRSGDTPARERQSMLRRPPHILITTPESFYILLTAERSRRMMAAAQTVIVDEIHAVAGDKRGAHLALSLERLDALAGRRLQRIGLSATQKPIAEIARLLVGSSRSGEDGKPDCAIVDVGHQRKLDLRIEVTDHEIGAIATHEQWAAIYDRIASHVRANRSTIVFTHTRRLVERVAHQLAERLGKDQVAAHHGSLSRQTRLQAEEGLKSGNLPVVVATASLELGIDVGHVDLVCHIGAPRALATLLQRVGRAGHWLGAVPKGILFALTRDDLVQCAAAVRAIRRGDLDRIYVADAPLDILAQQIVATIASQEMAEEELWTLVRRAYPYRDLTRRAFDDVLSMLSEGVATRRGRRSAHLHWDRVQHRLRARRGARLAAITGGGAIPENADYDVIEDPAGTFVGKVNEDFAVESMAGDIFLLGNRSWKIRRVEAARVRVEDAQGAPPSIPFWLGEAPARTAETSAAVSDLRIEVAARLAEPERACEWLMQECGIDRSAAEQIVTYLAGTRAALGVVPSQHTVVAERFFDESGGMQLVLHAPFGGRINRAWGLALRKRFCRTFDFELQAAATDDGIVLSLGEQHSFPLDNAFVMVRAASLAEDLQQAALQAPMFTTRWRWNVTRALALLRYNGGRRVPFPIQRMRADDLLAAVFPAQVACQDNHPGGPIEVPDHPLVRETIANCLHEAMDLDGLRQVLEAIERGTIRTVSVDTVAPSPMSHEILHANPYAFLDDAPLEERRARAVSLRRLDADLASGVGALDQAAIAEVRAQAWPDIRDADELHDFLLSVIVLPVAGERSLAPWSVHGDALLRCGRATIGRWDAHTAIVATERLHVATALLPGLSCEPAVQPLPGAEAPEPEEAVDRLVQGWLDVVGPITGAELARHLGLPPGTIEAALYRLEAQGSVLRGRFTSDGCELEWCERRLLARIHRLTLGRLRREVEAVAPADYLRFLLRWQHVQPGTQLRGRNGVLEIISQLQGLELPAPAWEHDVLRARMDGYDPADLEYLCLAGEVMWGRLRPSSSLDEVNGEKRSARIRRVRQAPTRSAPLAFFRRDAQAFLVQPLPIDETMRASLPEPARRVLHFLEQRGAHFLSDIARGVGLLPVQTEAALWDLVARGLVTGDGVAGLRTLLLPERKRQDRRRRLRSVRGGLSARLMPAGRWSLLRSEGWERPDEASILETLARQLLRRYGVVLREILARETRAPSWRALLSVYRRLEARGEIRGGRFVDGFVGEQYALPEAVDALRAVRRAAADEATVLIAAADPLNLVGILTPGARVSPLSGQKIAFRRGVAVDVGQLGEVRSRLQGAG